MICLSPPLQCWDYKGTPPNSVCGCDVGWGVDAQRTEEGVINPKTEVTGSGEVFKVGAEN